MKDQSVKIINLLNSNQILTSNDLAFNLNVSVRTIKSRIKEINTTHKNLIISTEKGYVLNKNVFNNIDLEKHFNQTNDVNREIDILNILINAKDIYNIYDLADKLYISYSTLKHDLIKAKDIANKHNVDISIKDEEIHLLGEEENLRRLQSNIIYNSSKIEFLSDEYIQNIFPNINISLIKYIIELCLSKNNFMINDFAMNNLILHLAILIKRYMNGETILEVTDFYIEDELIYKLSKNIVESVEYYFNIDIHDNEVKNFAMILLSRVNKIDYINMAKNKLNEVISSKNLKTINYIVKNIKEIYHLDLDEAKYYVRFCLHINNVLIRGFTRHPVRNPMIETIKSSAPLVYEISVTIAALIKDITLHNIGEDEIAYISFHIGSMIEEIYNDNNKVRTLVYCPNYFNLNNNILNFIKDNFKDELFIIDYTYDLSVNKYKNIDLIISTLSPIKLYKQLYVQISPLNNKENYYKIRNAIDSIKTNKLRENFKNNLYEIFKEDLFYKNNTNLDFSSTLDFMVNNLISKNYVDENFKKSVIDRENLSSTALGYFALPHPLNFNAKSTTLSVLISDNDIDWNGKKVRLIILMSFNNDQRLIFNEIYEPLTKILLDNNNFNKIIKSNNYEDFINNLVASADIYSI